jgi:WD40 repeat protein
MLRPDIIVAGTKDGKIKFWNLESGELERTLTVNNNLVIDMVLIEREAKPSKIIHYLRLPVNSILQFT